MRKNSAPLLVSNDKGLLKHWRDALQIEKPIELESFAALQQLARRDGDIIWLDLQTGDVPPWGDVGWNELLKMKHMRIVAASSRPKDEEAIAALDQGCAGYCHAYSDTDTLLQVQQVTSAGHIWIGEKLMQQLIHTAHKARPIATPTKNAWHAHLTARECEVAQMAANGASNLEIAEQCDITERTVKAHLSATFEKLGVADRLQLALKVHGIQ